jgi:hypothetical protein
VSQDFLERAIALIGKRRALRSPAIAEAFDCTPVNVETLLRPAVEAGRLLACSVETPEGRTTEYRLSLAAGGKLSEYVPTKHGPSPDPVKERLREWGPPKAELTSGQVAASARTGTPGDNVTSRGNAGDHAPGREVPRKEKQMSTTDKILAAYKAHGPMTARECAKYVKCGWLSIATSQLAARGRLVRLGGGAHSTIYGLPGQKAGAKAAQKASRGGKRMRRRKQIRARELPAMQFASAPPAVNGFRPAIAADRSLLLIGQAQAGELSRDELRTLAEFLRRVDRTGVRA